MVGKPISMQCFMFKGSVPALGNFRAVPSMITLSSKEVLDIYGFDISVSPCLESSMCRFYALVGKRMPEKDIAGTIRDNNLGDNDVLFAGFMDNVSTATNPSEVNDLDQYRRFPANSFRTVGQSPTLLLENTGSGSPIAIELVATVYYVRRMASSKELDRKVTHL